MALVPVLSQLPKAAPVALQCTEGPIVTAVPAPAPAPAAAGTGRWVAESTGGTMVATLVVALLLLCLAAGTEASPELSGEWGTGDLGTMGGGV